MVRKLVLREAFACATLVNEESVLASAAWATKVKVLPITNDKVLTRLNAPIEDNSPFLGSEKYS